MEENYIDKTSSFIEKNNLDTRELCDIMVAIVMADKLYSNRHQLSYDIMISTSDPSWRKILGQLGVESKQGKREIFDIDKYGLLCDTITIYAKKHNIQVENPSLVLEASKVVYGGIKLNSIERTKENYEKILAELTKSESENIEADIIELIKKGYKKNPVYTIYVLNKYANKSLDESYDIDTNTEFYKKIGNKLRYISKNAESHRIIKEEMAKI